MKTYQIAPDEVGSLVEELIEAYHPKLKEAGVTISLLFAYDGNGNAVSCGGYPALAVVRIVSLKDRVKGNKDAEIVIDAEKFEELDEAQQRALLDHELHHLDTVPDDSDGVKRDRAGRPKLAMRNMISKSDGSKSSRSDTARLLRNGCRLARSSTSTVNRSFRSSNKNSRDNTRSNP